MAIEKQPHISSEDSTTSGNSKLDEGTLAREFRKGQLQARERRERSERERIKHVDLRSQPEVVDFAGNGYLAQVVRVYWDVFREMADMTDAQRDGLIRTKIEAYTGEQKEKVRGDLLALQTLLARIEKYNLKGTEA